MTSRNRQGVAHEWTRAQPTDNGKTSTGNLFYRGRTIYSYGTNLPIAKWGYVDVTNREKLDAAASAVGTKEGPAYNLGYAPPGQLARTTAVVCLMNGSRYSSTTSGHQCDVRRAIPSSWIVFDVPHIDFDWGLSDGHVHPSHIVNWQSIVDAHQSELEKSVRARTMKASHLSNAETLRLHANSYRALFNLDVQDISENPDIQASIAAARAQRTEYERKNEERRVTEQAEKLQRWLDGQNSPTPYFDGEVRLRISRDGRNIETTKGASFPVRHALRAYPRLQYVRSALSAGEQMINPEVNLGHYIVDSIDENGITAGCHVVSWAEIERIYPLALTAKFLTQTADDYPEVTAVGSTLHS